MLGDHPFQSHQAGVAKQVRADLALLEWRQVDAVDAPRQQPGKVGLAHRQRQLAQILAVADQKRGLNDQRISIGPVIAVAREQAHALTVALNDQPVTVVLNFVDPRSGTLVPRLGMQGSNKDLGMGQR